jgi:hypothetical protein
VSYILDALKKAAEQRSGPPPEVRRLLSPAPVSAASPARYVPLAIAGAGAVAVAAVVWMWPAAHDVPVSPAIPVASAVATPPSGDPPTIAPEAKPRLERDIVGRPAVAATKPRETKPAQTTPLVKVAPTPAPPVVAALPPPPAVPTVPATAAPRTDVAKLKVEVIVYSELRPQRWAFINGRKYVEGDVIGDSARIEEIQSTGVVLVEDGRRFTIRP